MNMSEITYSILPPEDYQRLEKIFEEQDWQLPPPEISICAIAESEGEIVLVGFLQSILHSEPLWIRPDMRGKVDWKRAAGMLEEQVGEMSPYNGVVIIAENARVESMARKLGFEAVPGKLFRKVLEKGISRNGE